MESADGKKFYCLRCSTQVCAYSSDIQEVPILYAKDDITSIKRLNSNCCNACVCLCLHNKWLSIPDLLNNRSKQDGCSIVSSLEDMAAHYILSQVFYREEEIKNELCKMTVFDIPDKTDFASILWKSGNAVGFYSIKAPGSLIADTMDKYAMVTLDSVYIAPEHRRKGYCTNILYHIIYSYPNQFIGVSKPISPSMQKVLYKFLLENITLRKKIWQIDGTGQEGSRKLIWYSKTPIHKKKMEEKT